MSKDKLWAPWRIKYIQNKHNKKCIFCHVKKSKSFVVFTTTYSIVILNIYPYNNGHLMISPRRHVKDFKYLDDAEILDLFRTLNKVKELLDETLKPHGYNIGINIGAASGAGIPRHLHIHIVPRWRGDTNFMPVINNVKVISQSLNELHKLLINAYSRKNKRNRK